MKRVIQVIWLVSGILLCVVFALAINIGFDARDAMRDVKELWAQVTIEDLRQSLNLIQEQLDIMTKWLYK